MIASRKWSRQLGPISSSDEPQYSNPAAPRRAAGREGLCPDRPPRLQGLATRHGLWEDALLEPEGCVQAPLPRSGHANRDRGDNHPRPISKYVNLAGLDLQCKCITSVRVTAQGADSGKDG